MQKKIKMTNEQETLFARLKSLAKLTNQRILRFERAFKSEAIVVTHLKEKLSIEPLQAISKKGRVRVSKKFNTTQMQAIIKELEKFKTSKKTTRRGLKQIQKKVAETIRTQYSTEESEITLEEAEALAYFFEDKEVNKITNYIPGSDIIALIEEARENKDKYETFRMKTETIIKYNKGKSIENLLKKIYIKYINKGNGNKIEVVNNYIVDLINSVKYIDDIKEIEDILNEYKQANRLTDKEYNYFINKLKDKENEVL